jgi:hypothetical protein
MDRCVERPADHLHMSEGGRPIVRHGAGPFTVQPVVRSARLKAVAAQSLVENVRLAALCGLLRCEIAEDPKGNRRRRSMRRMPRELASGSSEKWRRPVSTGVSIPGSGPAANTDDRSTDRRGQCLLRTVVRTIRQERSALESCVNTLSITPDRCSWIP